MHRIQKNYHKLDYLIATCQFVPEIQHSLVSTERLLDVTSTSARDHNPRIVATIHALVELTHCDQVGDLRMEYSW